MKKVVILGQSVTAVMAVEHLRGAGLAMEVAAAGFADARPAFYERFPDRLARRNGPDDLFYQGEAFYRDLGVEFIAGRTVQRVLGQRRTVVFDDKSRIEADILIIAGSEKDQDPGVKGWGRSGVFTFRSAEAVARFHAMLGRIETVVLETVSLRGVLFAVALAGLGSEIIVCLSKGGILPGALDPGISQTLIALMERAGIRVIRQGQIREILGDAEVKAVRLDSGKVIAAEVAVFPDVLPDLRFWERSGLNVSSRLETDAALRTSCEGVYALDDMTAEGARAFEWFDIEGVRRRQSARLASVITGREISREYWPASVRFKLGGRDVLVIGQPGASGGDTVTACDDNGEIRRKIFVQNNMVTGAFLVDPDGLENHVIELLRTGQAIDWQNDPFFAGQDVCQGAQASGM